ncbi:MAG: GNAT family N-acetyltransferase [Colwellia sp.]|nr:GNAT family N-acetyltransferase [Colwellia sp.]
MTDINVRKATLDDMETLLEFEQGIVKAERPFDPFLKADPISYYDLKELVLSSQAEVLVAQYHDKIIAAGYAQVRPSKPYLKHRFHCYLGFMYVELNYRGRGINQLILHGLKKWSQSQDVHHFVLTVYAENDIAIRAYEKAGFKKDLIEMTLSLSGD